MNFEETVTIAATPALIYAKYRDVSSWQQWDADVQSVLLSGAFEAGATGTLIPRRGPKAAIKLIEVTQNQSFSTQTSLPLCSMVFEHKLQPNGDTTDVIHRISFSGPLAWFFARVAGSQLQKGLPAALAGLKEACES